LRNVPSNVNPNLSAMRHGLILGERGHLDPLELQLDEGPVEHERERRRRVATVTRARRTHDPTSARCLQS
jgi:hypothetical protein